MPIDHPDTTRSRRQEEDDAGSTTGSPPLSYSQDQLGGPAYRHRRAPAHVAGAPTLTGAIVLSLASAAAYGLAAVLQHHAAARHRDEPSPHGSQSGLVAHLVGQPIWLLGNLLDGVGFVLQFLALRHGSLTLVEPLLVSSVVFALPIASWLDHQPVSATAVASALATAAGLALFLTAADPGAIRPTAPEAGWIALTVAVAAGCALLAWGARHRTGSQAAVLLATGSGLAFGYVAAVAARTGHSLDRGALHTLTTPAPYALAGGGIVALVLTQHAFAAGALRLSLPTLTVVQPLVAIGISLGLFGQRIDTDPLAVLGELVGMALASVGVFALARSPAIVGPAGDSATA